VLKKHGYFLNGGALKQEFHRFYPHFTNNFSKSMYKFTCRAKCFGRDEIFVGYKSSAMQSIKTCVQKVVSAEACW